MNKNTIWIIIFCGLVIGEAVALLAYFAASFTQVPSNAIFIFFPLATVLLFLVFWFIFSSNSSFNKTSNLKNGQPVATPSPASPIWRTVVAVIFIILGISSIFFLKSGFSEVSVVIIIAGVSSVLVGILLLIKK